MKILRKPLLCTVVFVMVLCVFCACKKNPDNGGSQNGGGGVSENDKNVIFSPTVDVTLVYAKGVSIDISAVYDQVYLASGKHTERMDDTSEKTTAEIVFGNTSRPASKKAMELLDSKIARLKGDVEASGESTKYTSGFLFYAQGDTLAVVWDDDYLSSHAIKYLILNYMNTSTLSLKDGYSEFVSKDVLVARAEDEAEEREEKYANVREKYGAEIEEAIRTHLDMFGERYYMWLADLYDPGEYDEEGNPLGGGFYFSNSGRDTPGYGIDLESTGQVLAFLTSSGMLSDSDYTDDFPEELQKQMVAFALSCQSPVDGYFYHPQWGTDIKDSRRSRDCGWAVRILNYFGEKPYWNTPAGAEGLYGDAPGAEPETALSGRLSDNSTVSAVSKVMATAKKWTGSKQLSTLSAWREYLEDLCKDIRTKSYSIGNTVASQASQIENREKIAKANGEETGYIAAFEEYFNKYQLSNGLWEECSVEDGTVYYAAINGLMKISGGYNSLGVEINYAEEAIRAACFMITHIGNSKDGSDWEDYKGDKPENSVDVYNPWVSINNVLKSVRTHNGSAAAEELRDRLIKPYALEMIKTTTKKIAMFARTDGSYCYNWGAVGTTSQGAPVAVAGTIEGDVNGGNIAFTGTYREMVNALGIDVWPFGYSDFLKFADRLEELGGVIKDEEVFDENAGKFTFDDDPVESTAPADVTLSLNTGSVQVIEDTREGAAGNILQFNTLNGKGSTMTFKPAAVKNASSAILEWEMCFDKPTYSGFTNKQTSVFQIRLGDYYMLTLSVNADGVLTVGDASSTGTGISNKLDLELDGLEWNSFRVEYYLIDAETKATLTKVYINGDLRFVSNNYFGKESALTPGYKYTYAKFYALATPEFSCYFDNIRAYQSATPYTDEEIINPDRIKDFETDLKGVTTNGIVETEGGNNYLVLDGKDKNAVISATIEGAKTNCYSLNTKMKIDASAIGKVAKLYLSKSDESKAIVAYEIEVYEEGGVKYAKLVEYDRAGNKGASFAGLPVGEWFELRIEFYPYFYESEVSSIIYLGGEEIGRGALNYYIGTVAGPYANVTVETVADVKIALDDVIPESVEKTFKDEDGAGVSDPEITLPEPGTSTNTKENADHSGKFDFESAELGTPKVSGLQTTVNAEEYENRIVIATDPKDAVNKVIKHTAVKGAKGNTSYFMASKLSPVDANCYVFSFDLYIDSFTSGGIQNSIKGKIGTSEVNMFQTNINVSGADGVADFTIKAKRDVSDDLAEGEAKDGSSVIVDTAKFYGWVNVRFELYTDEGIVKIFYDDQLRAETNLVYSGRMTAALNRCSIFTTSGTNASIYYDNVVVEAVKKEYVKEAPIASGTPAGDVPVAPPTGGEEGGGDAPETPDTPPAPVINGVYDFEESQTGTFDIYGLAGKFTNGYATVMDDPRVSAGKVLEYNTLAGANESLTFTPKKCEDAKTLILAFDMLLVSNETTSLMQIKLDASYMISMEAKNGSIIISDFSSTDGKVTTRRSQVLVSDVDATKWHSYKIEYAIVNGLAMIKLYVDGTLSAVSGNYYDQKDNIGKPSFVYEKATFSSLSAAVFTMKLDNVVVMASDEEIVPAEYTHFSHVLGSKFEYTPITSPIDFEDGAVSGGIIDAPTIGDANYVSSSVVTDAKDAANKVLRVNVGSAADCKVTATYSQKVTPSNLDKSKDADGNYVQGSGAYVFSYDFRYDGAAPTKDVEIADIIFNHNPKPTDGSGYWNHIVLSMTANGELKVSTGNKSGTPNSGYSKVGAVVNDGEWHNIRVIAEKHGADDTVISVFLDDTCVIYKLNCYYVYENMSANSYILSVLWRQRKTTFDYSVELDNLYFEYAGDYDVMSGYVK